MPPGLGLGSHRVQLLLTAMEGGRDYWGLNIGSVLTRLASGNYYPHG